MQTTIALTVTTTNKKIIQHHVFIETCIKKMLQNRKPGMEAEDGLMPAMFAQPMLNLL